MFDAQIVAREGIVRRKKADVEKYASFQELLNRVRNEDYHLIETGDQYVVLCNSGALTMHA